MNFMKTLVAASVAGAMLVGAVCAQEDSLRPREYGIQFGVLQPGQNNAITDVEGVLVGQVNTELVGFINKLGGKAVGLSGVSGDIYHCHQRDEVHGYVGDIDYVDPKPIFAMLDAGYIPVIAPVGTDGQGHTFNINGDTAAGKLASALGAEKLVILTDIEGLCNDIKIRDVISYLNIEDVKALKDKGTIAGGMIPKVDCCVQAIEEGVTSVNIIDGRKPHSVLYEAFTNEGTGTTIGTAQPSVGIKW